MLSDDWRDVASRDKLLCNPVPLHLLMLSNLLSLPVYCTNGSANLEEGLESSPNRALSLVPLSMAV
jgi:hypothetical protein